MRTVEIKTRRRFYLRGLVRLPYKLKVILRFLFHQLKYWGYEFKSIELLRNKYDGQTIYIIGSGPSLSTYPDDFVDDKKSMTLHLSYLKFPKTTFTHFTEGDRIPPLIKQYPDFFKTQSLICNPLFPLDHPAFRIEGVNKFDKEPLYISYSPRRLHFEDVERQIDSALSGEKLRFQTNSTCLHTGIWSALILGFKDIRLIGCDHGVGPNDAGEGDHYFAKADIGDTRQRSEAFIQDGYYQMRVFTDEIIRIAKDKDITIMQLNGYDHYLEIESQ